MSSLVRVASRLPRSLNNPASRKFSTAPKAHEDDPSVKTWIYVTLGFTAIVGTSYLYNLTLFTPVEKEATQMSYTDVRKKPFPWKGAPHKSLFDISPDQEHE